MSKITDPSSLRVALLSGGKSGEREISIASGKGAKEALEQAGFNVTVLDPSVVEDLKTLIEESFDVAFLCLHGKWGEDGTVQGMLEVLGIPYTGSGVFSSALAMDKSKAKVFYDHYSVQTPKSLTMTVESRLAAVDIAAQVGNHCVVKPASEGSALGVFIVEGVREIEAAVEKVFELDSEVLVETYISGTELTVAVIGNEDVIALPVIEIVPTHDFYDFESKYAPGGSQHICPARLNDADTARVQEIAVKAHKALGCKGVSRTDIIMDAAGECWVLETNTLPGMTATSLLPDAGRAAGIGFPELCTKLIEYAL